MNCGYDYNTRIFSPERSQSMTILSPHKGQPRMTHLESLEAKMANIEVSLSSTNTPRRRKGTSLGGVTTTPSLIVDTTNINSNSKQEHHSAFQERDAIIQSLRVQLGLGKLPRPGLPLDESEVSKAEQELQKLRNNADKKRTVIRNLKTVLEDLDIQDNNIDVRIRQAEIEYALGREELQLLSLVEEIRALQFRLDKTVKSDTENLQTSLYFQLKNGLNMSLYAVSSNLGRFGINIKEGGSGIYVEWVLDGEALIIGDRIIECNGKPIDSQSKEEIQKLMDLSGRCQLVVIRINKQQNNQMLLQSQQDNQRLQHRISYLEDQVRDMINQNSRRTNQKIIKRDHVTSINISSSPQDNEGAQVFQRGNFIATIIGGKAIQTTHSVSSNGSATYRPQRNTLQHSHSQQYIGANSKIIETSLKSSQNLKDKHVRDHRKENHRSQPDLFYDEEKLRSGHQRYKKDLQDLRNARSLEFDSEEPKQNTVMIPKHPSVRREIDYTSEPVATPLSNSGSRTRNGRPTPPKKPLRLSLQGIQRTQSLQTIEANATATILDLEKKRSLKRTHRGNKNPDNDGETNSLFTASLGRNKYIEKTPNSHIN